MKKYLVLFIVSYLMFPLYSDADNFLEAPVLSNAEVINQTDSRLEIRTTLSHDETVAFYREALKPFSDIKFRDWPDDTYIEDDGKLPWHSITISKENKDGTVIVILKDNWTWIIGTLILRYIGVFVVLTVLLVGMSISGALISRSVDKQSAGGNIQQ